MQNVRDEVKNEIRVEEMKIEEKTDDQSDSVKVDRKISIQNVDPTPKRTKKVTDSSPDMVI